VFKKQNRPKRNGSGSRKKDIGFELALDIKRVYGWGNMSEEQMKKKYKKHRNIKWGKVPEIPPLETDEGSWW
jgi:hypothetical protein